MKTLGYEINTESDDDDDEGIFCFTVLTMSRAPVETANVFAALTDDEDSHDDDDLGDAELAVLHDTALRLQQERESTHRIERVEPMKGKRRVHIKSIAELENQQVISALPTSRKSLARLARLWHAEAETLGPHERWVMADSGSTLHALNVSNNLPDFKQLVAPLPEAKRGKGAESASGDCIPIDGTIDLAGHIDGDLHHVVFNDMKVSMPTASMRQCIKKGNDLHISPEGGTIRNRKSGRTLRLHERGGVYFFKMKFLPPHMQRPAPNDVQGPDLGSRAMGFHRPA